MEPGIFWSSIPLCPEAVSSKTAFPGPLALFLSFFVFCRRFVAHGILLSTTLFSDNGNVAQVLSRVTRASLPPITPSKVRLRSRSTDHANRVRVSPLEACATKHALLMPYVRIVKLAVACSMCLACALSGVVLGASNSSNKGRKISLSVHRKHAKSWEGS